MSERSTTRGRKFPPEPLSEDEIRTLLNALTRSRTGIRNRALICAMWRAGLRLDEALSLEPQNLDLNARTIRILHGKKDKARTVGIDQLLMRELQRWLEVRGLLDVERRTPLFCTLQGGKLWQTYVRDMLRKLATKAGIDHRVHPHAFRHSFAASLAREGKPPHVIQQLLGHATLSSTSVYLQTIAPTEAIAAIADRDVEGLDW